MNVIRVCGGVGNQFFQYAIGRVMVSKGIEVQYDLSWYKKFTSPPRPYCLSYFNTDVVENLKSLIRRKGLIQEHEKDFIVGLTEKDNYIIRGYWQNPQYHEDLLPLFRKELTIKEKFYTGDYIRLRKQITKGPAIAIHVRRQDFAKAGVVMLPMDYYRKALARTPKGTIYIFSDDLPWCKVNFREYENIVFVDLEEHLSFELLRLCQYKIIANSTYSFWAAYLGIQDQVVYRPDNWTTVVDGIQQKEYVVKYLPDWIKV